MRYFMVLTAVAVAITAVQAGAFTTNSATLRIDSSVSSVDMLAMQKQVGRDLPAMVIDNLF